MKLVNQNTTVTITVNVSVELSTQEEARDFLSYVRAYGKGGILVEKDGQQRSVRNIEKASHAVDSIRELVTTIADEPDGMTNRSILRAAKELGYALNPNSLSAALHTLKQSGKLHVIDKVKGSGNRLAFVYQTVR
jgi:hypothetical protein